MQNLQAHSTQLKHMTVGVLMAYAITSIAFLGYALLITYTDLSESNLPMVVAITTLLSVLVAGFDAARGAQKRGWIWGMAAGGVYVLIMVIIMVTLLPTFAVDSRTFTTILIGIAGGGLGGMLGINLKK